MDAASVTFGTAAVELPPAALAARAAPDVAGGPRSRSVSGVRS